MLGLKLIHVGKSGYWWLLCKFGIVERIFLIDFLPLFMFFFTLTKFAYYFSLKWFNSEMRYFVPSYFIDVVCTLFCQSVLSYVTKYNWSMTCSIQLKLQKLQSTQLGCKNNHYRKRHILWYLAYCVGEIVIHFITMHWLYWRNSFDVVIFHVVLFCSSLSTFPLGFLWWCTVSLWCITGPTGTVQQKQQNNNICIINSLIS